nr:hypothetical protein [Neobacillus sp. Marseille-Q6967]
MAGWWITTIGFVVCLGFVAGIMFYFLKGSLNSEDAVRIDPVKSDEEQ